MGSSVLGSPFVEAFGTQGPIIQEQNDIRKIVKLEEFQFQISVIKQKRS